MLSAAGVRKITVIRITYSHTSYNNIILYGNRKLASPGTETTLNPFPVTLRRHLGSAIFVVYLIGNINYIFSRTNVFIIHSNNRIHIGKYNIIIILYTAGLTLITITFLSSSFTRISYAVRYTI